VDREKARAVSAAILESMPVLDFNIEDIPVEEGIALLYNGGAHENG
jgi:ABC-2 type transport system ATP-binding protein